MADHILLRHRDIPDFDDLSVYLKHGGFEAFRGRHQQDPPGGH